MAGAAVMEAAQPPPAAGSSEHWPALGSPQLSCLPVPLQRALRRLGRTARCAGEEGLRSRPNITLFKSTHAHQMLNGRTAVGVTASGFLLNIWHETSRADWEERLNIGTAFDLFFFCTILSNLSSSILVGGRLKIAIDSFYFFLFKLKP